VRTVVNPMPARDERFVWRVGNGEPSWTVG
jgi:hypothetical protein